jgi:excisionase family DNA binding protein
MDRNSLCLPTPPEPDAPAAPDILDSLVSPLPTSATREQVAAALNVHPSTIDRAMARGELSCVHVGRAVRIPRTAVRSWLGRQEVR